MKINRKQGHIFMLAAVLGCMAFLFVFLFSINTPSARAISSNSEVLNPSQGSKTMHYVTIFDGNNKLVVKSDAITVRDVLARAEIRIEKNDIVEPGLDEKIDNEDFYVNIYRAREVVVIDGLRKTYVKTAAVESSEVAADAGVELKEADRVDIVPYDGLLESGMTSAYQIVRAKEVQLDFYGEPITKRTQANTIGEFLAEQGIQRDGERVWVSLADEEPIYDGIFLGVHHQGRQTVTESEEIPFDEQVTYDYSLEYGAKNIITPGKLGHKTVTYEVEMRDGQELSRSFVSEIITEEAETQQVVVGMKIMLPAGSHEDWMSAAGIRPEDYGYVNYIISHESGWRPNASNGKYHGLYQTTTSRLVNDCGEDWVNNAVCQISSANSYAVGRYGSWEGAYQHWTKNHWW